MLKLRNLLTVGFIALVFVFSSCADDTLSEIEDTIETTYDPDEDENDGSGINGGYDDPDEDENEGSGITTTYDDPDEDENDGSGFNGN